MRVAQLARYTASKHMEIPLDIVAQDSDIFRMGFANGMAGCKAKHSEYPAMLTKLPLSLWPLTMKNRYAFKF